MRDVDQLKTRYERAELTVAMLHDRKADKLYKYILL